MTRLVALAAVTLTACSGGTSTLLLELDGPAALTSLEVTAALDTGKSVSRTLALGAGQLKLPGTLLVILPERAVGVTLDLVGRGPGLELRAHSFVVSQPHEQVRVPLTLGASDDGGVLDARDAAGSAPVPRHISTSYYTDQSGSFAFPPGMSHTGFAINTTGVVDGDLLLIIANVDNGGTMVWPNPIAPGFNQLAQVYYGSDGQSYVVAWKIASHEPAVYNGVYGPGVGSSSAVLTLIAVSGADRTSPINAFLAGQSSTGMAPVVATSAGVITTKPNCTILYAAGSDWLGSPGSNTFTIPLGFTSLMQLGDHGSDAWDWSSQMVAWKTQPVAGATGAITGTLTSTTTGIDFTAVIAIAP